MSEANENDLFEKLQKEFHERIDEEMAARKTRTFWAGQMGAVKDAGARTALAALRKVRFNRAYAAETDETARKEFAALALAARKVGAPLDEVMAVMAEAIPEWKQERPSVVDCPPLPDDPVTGQKIRNPWLPLAPKQGDKAPRFDIHSQHLIRELSPRLAKWLQDCAANGGSPSLAMVDELDTETRRAEYLRNLKYDSAEWDANLLRPDLHTTLDEKTMLAREIQDQDLLEMHRREAKLGTPRCQFDNLGVRMALAKANPKVREAHKLAREMIKAEQKAEQERKTEEAQRRAVQA